MSAEPTQLGLLRAARAGLPPALNRGILMADGGPCALGYLWLATGHHPIAIYAGIATVAHPTLGGPAQDVIARLYGVPREDVAALQRASDEAPASERSAVVARILDGWIARAAG